MLSKINVTLYLIIIKLLFPAGYLAILTGPCWGSIMEKSGKLINCIDSVIDNFDENRIIYTINIDIELKKPIIKVNLSRNLKWFRFERSEMCIMSDENLGTNLKTLFTNPTINPRSRFVIITNEVNNLLFSTTSKFYINRLIVFENRSDSNQRIFSYNPYIYENVNNPNVDFYHLATCIDGIPDKPLNLNEFNIQQNWRNSTIQVLKKLSLPYTTRTNCTKYKGIEIDLFEIIAKKVGFKINYTLENPALWGDKINGSYTKIFGDLEKRKADMGIGGFHLKTEEHLDFDTSFNHMEDGLVWLVPKAKIMPHWKRLNLIFDKQIYFLILISSLIIIGFCRIFYRQKISSTFLISYQILMEIGVKTLSPFRVIFSCWIGACLVISTIFKSQLMVIMANNRYEHQIDSLSDIIASNLLININEFVAHIFDSYANPEEEYVLNNYENCLNIMACINRCAFVQDTVTAIIQREYEYTLHDYVDSNGYPLAHTIKTPIVPLHFRLFFVKGYPIFERIDQLLIRLKSSGVITHFYNEVAYDSKMALNRKITYAANTLGLEQLQIAFFIWFLGILTSIVVFSFEYFIKKLL